MPRCKNIDCRKKFVAKHFLQKYCMDNEQCKSLEYERVNGKKINSVSDKEKARQKLYFEAKKQYILFKHLCEFPGCKKEGEEIHHKAGRIGSNLYDESTFMHVCGLHHLHIHANPKESYAKGWLISKTQTL